MRQKILITFVDTLRFRFNQLMMVEFSDARSKTRICQGIVNRKEFFQLKSSN